MRRMNIVLMVQTKLPIQVFLNIVVKFMISVSKDDLIHDEIISKMYLIENKEVTLLYKLNR